MNDISEDAGDTELALAMEEQVNARVMAVLEKMLGLPDGELTAHAGNPREVTEVLGRGLKRAIERADYGHMKYQRMMEHELAQQNMLRAKDQQVAMQNAAMQNAASSAIGQRGKQMYTESALEKLRKQLGF